MRSKPWPIHRYEQISQSFGVLAIIVSGAALIGWFTDSTTLKGIRAAFIPMAPNTALVFLLLSAVLILVSSNRFPGLARFAALPPLVIVAARLSEYLTGHNLTVDHWLFHFPADHLGLAPVGKMAFFTAFTFLLSAASLFLLTFANSRRANTISQALAAIILFSGAVFSLGYVYGNPLTYDWHAIPMALNTAICFCLYGAALLVKSNVRNIKERRATADALRSAHEELESRVNERTAKLHEQEEFLRAIVDTSPSAVFVKDSSGRFTFVNKAVETVYGRPALEIIGRTEFELNVQPKETETFVNDDAEVLRTLAPKLIPEGQLTNPTTGETRFFQTIKVPLKLPGSDATHVLGVATDITERKKAEEALHESEEMLRQAQKMESIGTLAGGIAHDFNNLMTVVTGYSELALRRIEPNDPLRSKIEEIRSAGERAASLTRQLLAFSRKQILKPVILDLNTVVTGMGKMLPRLLGEDIDLRFELATSLDQVKADPGQMEQVLMNLAVNARDAMPTGGRLIVKTENVEFAGRSVKRRMVVKPGSYVVLSVTDNGTGMNAETQSHIFEPFFTTKEIGKGTGLGLATVYGIVKQSGGSIWVYSEPGKGTTFRIYLPREDEVAATYDRQRAERAVPQGDETILLVEDEESVRNLAKEILEAYGYEVLTAANGAEGVRVCREYTNDIDLILTDVVMPQMSGRELAESVHTICPDTRVLYMSGFTDDAVVHHGVVTDGTCFIQKPFSPEGLAMKVREVLDYAHGEDASLSNDQLALTPSPSIDLENLNHGYNPIN